jgi:hypothetical protein
LTASHANLMAEAAKLSNQRRQEENKRGGMTF